MIIHYGYSDGSGEYYIIVNAQKCNSCGKCVKHCPQRAIEMQTIMVDLEDKNVPAITESHRKKIKYTCSSCRPETKKTPCILACDKQAIDSVWNIHRKNAT